MEPHQISLGLAVQTAMHRLAGRSQIYAVILSGWLKQPPKSLAEIIDRYCRILSTSAPDLTLLMAGLHYIALKGDSSQFAPFCPSCGGRFRPEEADQVRAATEADLTAYQDDVLDFMLGQEYRREPIEATPLLLLGCLVAASDFGGAVSLVEIGCGGGSRLLFDQYRYQFGSSVLGAGAHTTTTTTVEFKMEVDGPSEPLRSLVANGMPKVISRRGLSTIPVDLTDRDELQLYEAFLPPDNLRSIDLLRSAAEGLIRHDHLDIQQGDPATDLLAFLSRAYEEMPPGNTLLLTDLMQWNGLLPEDRNRVAYQVQSFVARLQPLKPVAWLQVDWLNPSSPTVEARLHLFGWADPEDRSVRRIAEVSPDLTRLRWMG